MNDILINVDSTQPKKFKFVCAHGHKETKGVREGEERVAVEMGTRCSVANLAALGCVRFN